MLEAYVLGDLSTEEMLDVERMSQQHLAVKQEIERITESLDVYALSHAVTPPAYLKSKILKAIAPLKEKDDTKIIQLQKKLTFAQYLAAASLCGALIAAVLGIFYYSQWRNAEATIIALNQDRSVMANQVNVKNSELENSEKLVSILQDTNTTFVALKGLPISPSSNAKIYWNQNLKEVYLKIENLPAPPTDKQYQLWALKDGKPIDAGVFQVDSSIQKMKDIEGAQAFAVTLEKKGGSPSPTLEAMYMMGAI